MNITFDTDRFIREVIEGNEYSFLFKDLVVLDVGCNIGTFSFWLYDLAKEIYAIDIAKKNTDTLLQTIKNNQLDKIRVFNCGIAGTNGGREIVPEAGEAENGGWKIGNRGNTIETFTLTTFMKKEGINYVDVLKMDVEGAEEEIFDAEDFPKDKINTIIGEVHGDLRPLIQARLTKLGYRYIDLGGHFMARKI